MGWGAGVENPRISWTLAVLEALEEVGPGGRGTHQNRTWQFWVGRVGKRMKSRALMPPLRGLEALGIGSYQGEFGQLGEKGESRVVSNRRWSTDIGWIFPGRGQ